MSKFINYTSALTSVTAQVDTRSLSAVPHFTEGNTYTTLTCGFSASRTFNGYSFDTVEAVMLSAENNELHLYHLYVTVLPYLQNYQAF